MDAVKKLGQVQKRMKEIASELQQIQIKQTGLIGELNNMQGQADVLGVLADEKIKELVAQQEENEKVEE